MLRRLTNAPSWLSAEHHTDILCSEYSSPLCTASLMYTLSLSFPRLSPPPSFCAFPPSPPSPLELRGAHLSWRGEDRPSDMPTGHGIAKNEHWQIEHFDNTPSRIQNCLSCPISGIWLQHSTYGTSNLTSTGRNDRLSALRKTEYCNKVSAKWQSG